MILRRAIVDVLMVSRHLVAVFESLLLERSVHVDLLVHWGVLGEVVHKLALDERGKGLSMTKDELHMKERSVRRITDA